MTSFDKAVGVYHLQLLSKFQVENFSCLNVIGKTLLFVALGGPKTVENFQTNTKEHNALRGKLYSS